MKKINIVFLGLIILTAVIGILHTGIVFVEFLNAPPFSTSFPAWVAFFWFVPYAIVAFYLFIAWIGVYAYRKDEGASDEEKAKKLKAKKIFITALTVTTTLILAFVAWDLLYGYGLI